MFDAAVGVVQAVGLQDRLPACGDLATRTVVERLGGGDVQVGAAGALHCPTLVEQVLSRYGGVAVAGDHPALVVDIPAAADLGRLGAGLDDLPSPVAEASDLNVQVLGLGAGTVVVDTVGRQAQVAIADDLAPRAVQCGGGDGQGARSGVFNAAVGVVQYLRTQAQVGAVAGDTPAAVV